MALFEMTEAEASRWAEQREVGQRRFVLTHGVGWGVVFFVLHAVWSFFDGSLSPAWVGLNAFLWPVSGIALYLILWRVYERLFRVRGQGAKAISPLSEP